MVTGAIRRAALEDPSSPLSYTDFVNELDTGDMLTTTLMDVLVKEVTDRRKRPAADRRFISEKTARSLRQLTAALNIYHHRPRSTFSRRRTAYGGVLVDTDEDEFENMLEDSNPAEGSHMSSSELFEAMSVYPLGRPVPGNPSAFVVDDGPAGSTPPSLRSPSIAPRTTGPWTVIPATSTASNTIRSHSAIRRNYRRNTDFNEFQRRHRSSIRASLAAQRASDAAETPESVTEPRPDGWTSRIGPPSGRRYFAQTNPLRRLEQMRRQASGVSEGTDGTSGEDETLAFINIDAPTAGPSTSATGWGTGWTTIEPPEVFVSPRAIMLRAPSSDNEGPSLRRGGVSAPETIQPPPAVVIAPETTSEGQPVPVETTPSVEGPPPLAPLGEPAAYPTPGSVENEHLT
ncbi:hypothetical protein CC1G_01438 [Coprinopsis cinerea okayama7|uniref:Uncharacterized protein n=1 Tax=Coprinopsis cinerea (strain Okayama-7 / 130 / ATCC MYA-4618 / FGSC 9003) TaxID=240176 RepID=A8NYU5_COPC7|nr:hypothetical protein CC1G_01438 [Coprinopsis cinerea okayama7\|eukprot:XP_001837526.2 hypothetical protein CC1G_01438 [Coprinopsis cinerea okayama7\